MWVWNEISPYLLGFSQCKQSNAHSLIILIQELVISQLTRKAKVKMKTPFNQMVDRLSTCYLHSNNKGKKKGDLGNIEYDHKHKFISPSHMKRSLIEFSYFISLIAPTGQRPALDKYGIIPSIGKQHNLQHKVAPQTSVLPRLNIYKLGWDENSHILYYYLN